MVVACSLLLLPLERISTFPISRIVSLPSSVYANTGKDEYDRNPLLDFGLPIFCFLETGIQSLPFFIDFPPSRASWKSWNEKARGEKRSRNFVLSLSLLNERRYKGRNTSCLVNITGRGVRGERAFRVRGASPFPLPPIVYIHRSRGSTPRFGAVTTDEFRMSPANGKQRGGRWSLTPPQSFHVERSSLSLSLGSLLHFPHTPFLAPSFLPFCSPFVARLGLTARRCNAAAVALRTCVNPGPPPLGVALCSRVNMHVRACNAAGRPLAIRSCVRISPPRCPKRVVVVVLCRCIAAAAAGKFARVT